VLKKIFWLLFTASIASTAANAQPAILRSDAVKKTRACLDKLKADAQAKNFYVDRDAGIILVQHPTDREALLPLQVSMFECLDDAFDGKTEIVKNPRTGTPSRIWYNKVENYYSFCASNSLTREAKDIDILGGRGERRAWLSVHFNCSIDESILGFHRP